MNDFLALSAEQASRLTGLSVQQIFRLDTMGVLTPTVADENRRRPFSRIYSFRDIVGLRTIALFRKQHHIPLRELRALGQWLARHHDAPWSSLRLFVTKRRLFFQDPTTGNLVASKPIGQTAMPILLDEIAQDVRGQAARPRERDESEIGCITRHRTVAQNAYVIAGTRIPTAAVYDFHSAGYDTEAIIREYPRLTPADVMAAIAHEERTRRRRAS